MVSYKSYNATIIASFFQLDLPVYTTDEICRKRMITAITMCGEIDTDGSAAYIDDDNDEGDNANGGGRELE